MRIEDIDNAEKFLMENNYFRVSGFTLCHRKNNIFQRGFNFKDVEDICEFDSEIRMLIGSLSKVGVT